ncbi:exopolysaccharide biosynthesis protein [Hoeflea sp. WL0058]|uniref:Exopolysaccharide biosynthesis protein n=1 Tax=Flavimaribacter sediminis TaxID=2865987 RepID=A0AAE2ZMD4_9HYPH|nr:exopolysaccharide biosynthesis protein [Flavimaribacter sediminis]
MSDTTADKIASERANEAQEHTESLSSLLQRLANAAGERITLKELATALDERSFGAFLLVFALPNLIPLPPGATLILGLPLIFISWQIVAGRQKIWLPRRLANYSLDKKTLVAMVTKVDPWLRRMEAWVRPRHWPLKNHRSERLFGIYILILAIVVLIPIPFCNWLPAFAIAIIGLAHTEQDGNCLGVGVVVGVMSIAVLFLMTVLTTVVFASLL